MAENFDRQWRDLRRYATIENDPQKLARLRADWRNAKPLTGMPFVAR